MLGATTGALLLATLAVVLSPPHVPAPDGLAAPRDAFKVLPPHYVVPERPPDVESATRADSPNQVPRSGSPPATGVAQTSGGPAWQSEE